MKFQASHNDTYYRVSADSWDEAAEKVAKKVLKGHRGVQSVKWIKSHMMGDIFEYEAVAKDGARANFTIWEA